MNPDVVRSLIDAGTAGLVITVVLIFLNYMKGERVKSDLQSQNFLTFIAEQREAHLATDLRAAEVSSATARSVAESASAANIQMAQAMTGLAGEIKNLNEGHVAHDARMSQALLDMNLAKAKSKR